MLKLSQFNSVFQKQEEVHVYNSLSGSIVAFDKELWAKAKSDVNRLMDKEQAMLLETGLAVPTGYDELAFIANREAKAKANQHQLALTVLPAMACNFNCPYCYEAQRRGVMSEEVANHLIRFVTGSLSKEMDLLDVTWFGGEPLIGRNIIHRLSRAFIAACESNGVRYETFMVTNGSLLNEETRQILQKCRVTDLQITIDGPAKIHDCRRPSLSGQGTYERIMQNIIHARKSGFNIDIRINIDQTNLEHIPVLLDELGQSTPGISICFARVDNTTDASSAYSQCFSDNRSFAPHLVHLTRLALAAGLKPRVRLNQRRVACAALLENHFLINPTGTVAKCWNEAGDESKVVGQLSPEGKVVITNSQRAQDWLAQSGTRVPSPESIPEPHAGVCR